MQLPTANKAAVEALIEKAQEKLERFEEKLERIEQHIQILQHERQAAETTIEYFELSSKRQALLLDLFVFPHEYGETQPLPEWHIERLQEHSQNMLSSIKHYERCKRRRLEGVDFLKADLKRLEIIGNANFQHRFYFQALLDV